MTTPTKSKRFRLSFEGPIEDQPRLIRSYGRACDGEFALVMRPGEARSVLVLITKKDGAFVWRSDAETDQDDRVQASATVLKDGRTTLRIETGDFAGDIYRPHETLAKGLAHGDVVQVAFKAGDEFAQVRGAGAGGDSILRPETVITESAAVALIKSEQKKVPKPGPTTLRGRWTGYLYCDGGKPQVELQRKLATYGTLTVRSHLDAGWSWTFVRTEKWFSGRGDTSGEGLRTLSEAIEGGVLGAMSLVREACSFRDTRRRAAHDSGYAEKHPIKPPRAMKNPTDRLRTRKTAPKKAAPVPQRMPKKRTESAYTHAKRLLSEANARVGEGHHAVARELLDQAGRAAASLSSSKSLRLYEHQKHIEDKLVASLTPEGWEPFEVGDAVSFGDALGTVSWVPSGGHSAVDKVTFLTEGRRRGRKVEARLLERAEADESTLLISNAHLAEADAEKDQHLIDAFSAAIAASLNAA